MSLFIVEMEPVQTITFLSLFLFPNNQGGSLGIMTGLVLSAGRRHGFILFGGK